MKTMEHSYQPGMQRNYRSRATNYLRFCHFYQLTAFPTNEWDLVRYACYLANGVTSYGTITGYLSSIKRLREIGRFPFPTELHNLKLQLIAIKYELVGPVKKAIPITPVILLDFYSM